MTTLGDVSRTKNSEDLFARAREIVPGGVNSPVRAFGAVGGTPRFMVSGQGPYITDADGNRYVDLVCSWGPMILGHAHPAVSRRWRRRRTGAPRSGRRRRARSSSPRRSSPGWTRWRRCAWSARAPRPRCPRYGWPAASPGDPRSSSSPGCYHGHVDALLAAAGSGVVTFGLPDTPGVTGGLRRRHHRAALQHDRGGRRGVPDARRPRSPA